MQYYLSVCAIMKNEGLYLKEWLEFHRMVGVEHFYLYDNESTDMTRAVLQPYIHQGIVTCHSIAQRRAQLKAYMHCLSTYRNTARWIGFIDLDEFIVLLAHENVPDFLQNYEEYAGVGINWLLYGTSGHVTRPEGLIIEHFTQRSTADWRSNRHIKSIVNPCRTRAPLNPHCFTYQGNGFAVDENKNRINGPLTQKNSTEKIRINHYFTRSEEESRQKMERGSAYTNTKRPWSDFERLNRNDVHDRVMEKYVPELKQRVYG